jgi:acyl transferase domain-containing protein
LLTGRALLSHRALVAAGDRDDLLAGLDAIGSGDTRPYTVAGIAGAPPKAVFVFPGQGAQRLGMGRALHARFPVFATAFDEACARLDARLDGSVAASVRDVVFAVSGSPEADLLDQTVYTQAALFAVETALFRLAESWEIRPHLVLGHSIGEITAAHVAGMLSLDDAVTVVAARGLLMQALPPGGAMVAVSATVAEIGPYLGAGVDLAAVNTPSAVVLSGDEDAVLDAAGRLHAAGRKVKRLPVSHAFHSARMEPMLAEFAAAIASVTWRPPQIEMVAAQDGDMRTAGYWVEHVRRPVRFADGVTAAIGQGGNLFIEMGPGAGLSGPVMETGAAVPSADSVVCVPVLRDGQAEEQAFVAALAELFVRGAAVDWQALLPAGAPAIELPTYAFDHRHYWLAATSARTDAAGPRDLGANAAGSDAMFQVAWTETASSTAEVPEHRVVPVVTAADVTALRAGDGLPAVAVLEVDRGRDALPLLSDVLAVLQAWQAEHGLEDSRLAVVTRGAVPVGTAVTDVSSAAVWGLVRAAQAETPDRILLVDIDAGADREAAVGAALATGEPQLAVRDTAFVPRLAPCDRSRTYRSPPTRGTVLVTGGTGSLGASWPGHLSSLRRPAPVCQQAWFARRWRLDPWLSCPAWRLRDRVARDVSDRPRKPRCWLKIAPEHELTGPWSTPPCARRRHARGADASGSRPSSDRRPTVRGTDELTRPRSRGLRRS